jgi:hypothetical protein
MQMVEPTLHSNNIPIKCYNCKETITDYRETNIDYSYGNFDFFCSIKCIANKHGYYLIKKETLKKNLES